MEVLQQFGLPTVAISVLGGTVLFLYNELKNERKRSDELQEKRVQEARETNVRLTEPMSELIKLSEKTYDLLLSNKRGN